MPPTLAAKIRRRHNPTTIPCIFVGCRRWFRTKSGLKQHVRVKHEGTQPASPLRMPPHSPTEQDDDPDAPPSSPDRDGSMPDRDDWTPDPDGSLPGAPDRDGSMPGRVNRDDWTPDRDGGLLGSPDRDDGMAWSSDRDDGMAWSPDRDDVAPGRATPSNTTDHGRHPRAGEKRENWDTPAATHRHPTINGMHLSI